MKKLMMVMAIVLIAATAYAVPLIQGVHLPMHHDDDPGGEPGTWEYNCMDTWGKTRCSEFTQDGSGIIGWSGGPLDSTDMHDGDAGTGGPGGGSQWQSRWWPMQYYDPNLQYVIYDLGAEYDLAKAYLWQSGQNDHNNVAVRDFNLLVAHALGGPWTQIGATRTLAQDPTPGDPIPSQGFDMVATARFVQIDVVSSWHNDGWVGLAEVGFEEAGPAGPPIAEPAGLGLVGLALLGLRRRRP